MGSIQDNLLSKIKDAMRAKSPELGTLRMLQSALKYEAIDSGGTLSDDQELAIVRKLAKQRDESAAMYDKGNRPDLAETERKEKEYLLAFLPAELSDSELADLLRPVVEQNPDVPNVGMLMKPSMALVAGRANGNRVKQVLEQLRMS